MNMLNCKWSSLRARHFASSTSTVYPFEKGSSSEQDFFLISNPYLPPFGKLKSGHLRCVVIQTMMKLSLRGPQLKPSLFLGGPGHTPPENFENRDCQISIFSCFVQ